MKIVRIFPIVVLLLFLAFVFGCQPNSTENMEEKLDTILSVPTVSSTSTRTLTEIDSVNQLENSGNGLATHLPEPTTSPANPSPTQILSGDLFIASEPEGAKIIVGNEDISGQTPINLIMSPGIYTTTITLKGYVDWTAPITVTAGETFSLTANLRQAHHLIPVAELGGPLWHVEWADEGQSLIYAMNGGSLPIYQDWWHYDVINGVQQALTPPETRVTKAVRESLGICPFPLPEPRSYPCLPTLWESPTNERIVFSSGHVEGEINTWLANVDGSNALYLDTFPGSPGNVMWSSDDEWLLIGLHVGVDGSNLYYLVKSDGSFVKSLEEITNTSHFRVQGPKPQFSPDGQKLAFVGTEAICKQMPCEDLDIEDEYNLYILDLDTFESQLISSRFGLFQWTNEGNGLYVLDGSANTAGHSVNYSFSGMQLADFYYIDLTRETPREEKLLGDIPLYLPYLGAWSYSPEAEAMAGIFDLDGRGPMFSILSLK